MHTLASYPGSRIKGMGGKESLVHTAAHAPEIPRNLGK